MSRRMNGAAAAVLLAVQCFGAQAQMAQDPLLSRTAAVEPNIVFVFDDSASMVSTAIYQYGGGAGYQGNRGPNDDAECLAITSSTCKWTSSPPPDLYGRSPDVNLIYYDPRVKYTPRINADGTYQTATALANSTSFNVYFYRTSVLAYKVTSIPVTKMGAGFSATPPAIALPTPGGSGTRATATVTTIATKWVTSVGSINSGNWYTSDPGGQSVTFAAPPGSTGTTAAGTVVSAASAGGITAVALNNSNTFGSTSSCTVGTTSGGGGSGFVGTATYAGGKVTSFTVTSPGSGYGTSTKVRVTCGTTVRDYNVTLASAYRITGVTMTSNGSGYSTAPAVTFPTSANGVTATGTAVLGNTYGISAINITNGGTLYNACIKSASYSLSGAVGSGHVLGDATCSSSVVAASNSKWDGTINPNGLVANKGPISAGDYFTSYLPCRPDASNVITCDANSPLDTGASQTVPYPTTSKSTVTTYPKFKDRTDCTTTAGVCTWAEELANYAIWKSFHSTRLDLAKTGIGLAFQPLNPTFRLGWGTLGKVSGKGSASSQCGSSGTAALEKGVRLFTATTQSDFLTWLYAINGNVLCTPSRIAIDNVGTYYKRADANGPWAASPSGDGALTNASTQAGHASCRRSYSMLMTDGYYNDTFSMTPGDYDSTNGPNITQPRAYQYTPIGPYSDNVSANTTYSNSLADVAMKYWLTDLRPDLSNSIKPVTSDDAFWQHMNFYAIGLGLVGTIDATSASVLQSLSGNSPARTASWPVPTGDDPRAIDDMWHATINGHGKLLNAKTADELNKAIQQMMSDISGKEGTQSGVAVSTISLTSDTKKYTPLYTPVTWNGNVVAYNLNTTNARQQSIAWQVETLLSTDPDGTKHYQSRIPAAASRSIYVGNNATGATRAVPFTYTDMSTAGIVSQLGSTGVNANLVNYLRGDDALEDTSTSTGSSSGIYRPRQTRLGDVVNSTPVFVRGSLDMAYDTLPSSVSGQSTYGNYRALKQARAEGVLFVGANDGMLHAFRDGTYDSNDNVLTQGGIEVFAYVPYALLPSLSKLASQPYTHQYYVDGPITETDAYLPSRGGWTNVVLGSTGAGAGAPAGAGVSPRTAVFALDVTSLNTSPTGLNASSVMWEVSSTNVNFTELGYMLNDVQAGVTASGDWVAVFGNGYDSKSCQARLFIVDMKDGSKLAEISTATGSCTAGSKNGLGGVRLVRNNNQQVIGAYAGDLLGNVWKFDLSSNSKSGWKLDLAGQPLYKAGATQPVTAPPTVLPLPMIGTTDPKPGYMVVFGTGKFYEVGDITTTTQQTVYGVWDPLAFGATYVAGTALTNNSLLVQQTIGSATTGGSGNNYFQVSNNAVNYTGTVPKRGWYINLPNSGQRLIYPIDLLASRFIVADTMSPANVSLDPCSNSTGGTGYLYFVDALNGGGPTVPILDTNGDGNIDSLDSAMSGLESTADGRNVSIIVSQTQQATTYANVGGGSSGSTIVKIPCSATNSCPTPATTIQHQWRQLFLR